MGYLVILGVMYPSEAEDLQPSVNIWKGGSGENTRLLKNGIHRRYIEPTECITHKHCHHQLLGSFSIVLRIYRKRSNEGLSWCRCKPYGSH